MEGYNRSLAPTGPVLVHRGKLMAVITQNSCSLSHVASCKRLKSHQDLKIRHFKFTRKCYCFSEESGKTV